jgi:hypothetical protein
MGPFDPGKPTMIKTTRRHPNCPPAPCPGRRSGSSGDAITVDTGRTFRKSGFGSNSLDRFGIATISREYYTRC